MLLGAALGALFGALFGAYKSLLRTTDKVAKNELPTFFLNILLLNKKAVIKAAAKKRIKHGLFGFRQRIAGSVASTVVSDKKFTIKIAEQIVVGIPPKLRLQAIEASAELVFVEKNYAVVSVSIKSVDSLVLVGKQVDGIGKTAFHVGKVSFGETVLEWLGLIGAREYAEFAMSTTLSHVVERKMVEVMGEQLMKKLQLTGGVECVVEVKHARDQPSYFYSFLKMLKHPTQTQMDKDEMEDCA